MKQRFSSLDVRVISHELTQNLISLRVANIYDLSSFAKPGSKQQLLVDSGFRCHLTAFSRTTAAAPSAFVTKLRKYLKTRRVTSITQIGTDRVVELQFSDGQFRLFLEFFAAGNIVLTDKDLNVLTVLRTVSEGNEDVDVKLGGQYSLKPKQNYSGVPPLSEDRLKASLEAQIQKAATQTEEQGKKIKKKKRKDGDDLRQALTRSYPEYPPHLLEHAFKQTGFDPSKKPQQILEDPPTLAKLFAGLQKADQVFRDLSNSEQSRGYIVAKVKNPDSFGQDVKGNQEGLSYDDIHPFHPSQFDNQNEIRILEVEGFNKAADEFFSSLESQKLESRLNEREENAKRKLETAREDHKKRLGTLQQVQELHIRQAEAISANPHRVQEAIDAVNGLIAQGMDWMDIAKLIVNEQKRDNLVAKMIKLPLKLYENTVTLLLAGASADEDDEDEGYKSEDESTDSEDAEEEASGTNVNQQADRGPQLLPIDIDLALSPWANANNYYDQKKSAAQKEQKTIQSSARALKNAESKIAADLKKGLKQEKQVLQPTRKQMWFEKFHFFISSDGYLVLGGKDAQQNEILYRRYLKKGDIYVHADLQGAASVIVKNMLATPDAPIPPSTLSQAGALSVCTSSAWDSKAVMAAWWVEADQVSKTAPTGEYITTGGFMVRGKKNFLPPSQLLLGFGVMFQISEDSKSNHNRHRLQHTDSVTQEDQKALDSADSVDEMTVHDAEDDKAGLDTFKESEKLELDSQADGDDGLSLGSDSDEDNEIKSNDGSAILSSNPLQTNQTSSNIEEGGQTLAEEYALEKDGPSQKEAEEDETASQESAATHDDEQPSGGQASDAIPNSKRHLTARERRLLRKGKADPLAEQGIATTTPSKANGQEDGADDSEDDETNDHDDMPSDTAGPSTATTSATSSKIKNLPLIRGKRTKAKRAAQKYALQDAEDRALAMSLLGSPTGAEQKKADVDAERAAAEDKARRDKERRRAQHEKAVQAERRRQQEGAKAGAGDTGAGDDEVSPEVLALERQELANLDALVGWPQPGDEILHAIPICAPWSALSTRCKYKVKLQPGSLKKGKAVREIVGMWAELAKNGGPKIVDAEARDRERVWPREVECVRAWKVDEVFGVVPVGKVRVMAGGGLGGASGGGGGGGGKGRGGKGGARGGKGSKKAR
ncbi:MAG: hypothetical protein Q9160_002049 [Pyrenula sp. 1 TL-2023]